MNREELVAYLVFGSYFAAIFSSFFLVFRSILSGVDPKRLLHGRPFLFLRTALGALLCTGYFLFNFINWSYTRYAYLHTSTTLGQWLSETQLFEQAWSIVCTGPSNWWWSSFICTWTVIFTAVVWAESGRREIRYPWAYMVLGQLVAISVSTSLFITALLLHPRVSLEPAKAPVRLWLPLALAMATIHLVPQYVGTDRFLNNLLWMHGLLVVPLLTSPERGILDIPFPAIYTLLPLLGTGVHIPNTIRLLRALPQNRTMSSQLYQTILAHPAQSSISLDVIWVAISISAWFLTTGSTFSIALKSIVSAILAFVVITSQTGVNWAFVVNLIPFVILAAVGAIYLGLGRIWTRNSERRIELLASLGIVENSVIAGTEEKPPSRSGRRTVVGFWHPYCNAGGGGERVLWSAIACLQSQQPDVVCLVYSGDYPTASKEAIIGKVQDRFSITLDPSTIAFIPLPSRRFISDDYWSHFTLLGQSLGSMYLAWEGLCGADGLWGDVFLDSMGYAFTYPFVRMVAGSEIAIGSYIHYPTVSADMVKRVRERSAGVENAGASSSWLRTQIKLLYYRIFTTLYATSLLYSQHIMTNSSWTQAHIKSLLSLGRSSFLAILLLLDDTSKRRKTQYEKLQAGARAECEVVYPPCDTAALVKLGNLDRRKGEIVSLAQFRPEKEHAKQIHALSHLFASHPEYRSGPSRISLTLMGGARHPADEGRVESLRLLSRDLGIHDNVEFLVNAPYPEVVRRLGVASVGLNTMQDEHFGINVVEFMPLVQAAGLIPIVHASAGPVMDIVVPHNGQRTGFHAKSAQEFASAMHEAFSLSSSQAMTMREAARTTAVEKFSLEGFEQGFVRGWEALRRRSRARGRRTS